MERRRASPTDPQDAIGSGRQDELVLAAFEAGSELLAINALDLVVSGALERLETLFGVGTALLALQSDGQDTLRVAATRGTIELPLETAIELPPEQAAALRQSHAVTLEGSGLHALLPQPAAARFERGWAIPLMARESFAGMILALESQKDTGVETKAESRSLRIFAEQAAHAIAHARLYAEVERMAETDALTGLRNRHHFERALRQEIARVHRHRHPVSLLMVDVCDFKRINDAYGHLAGDTILKNVARLLENNIRESDIVARFGGDEFVVLMPDTSEDQARLAQQRITHATARYNDQAQPKERFMLSMGLKSALEFTPEVLIDEADRAMYQDKDVRIRRRIIEALVSRNDRDLEELDKTVASVLRVLREKEAFYFPHALRVMPLCVRMARQMALDDDATETVALAALLHDLGKAAVQTSILNKPGALTEEEYETVKTHAALGDDMLSGIERLREVRAIIRAHHERWDGRTTGAFPGYPDGLAGEAIPLGARMIRIADMFDALTSDRPYRSARSPREALAIMEEENGGALDPELTEIFLLQQKTR